MKNKLLALSVALALSTPLFADRLMVLKCSEDGIPGQTEPALMGFSISANGKYICGAIESASGIFVADTQNGEVKWKLGDESGGELRGIDNDGVAIGYLDADAVLTPFESMDIEVLKAPSDVRSFLGESLTNDGSLLVGSFADQSFNTVAAYYSKDSGWNTLPMPSEAEVGNLKDLFNDMSAAKFVSGDGKVILGHLGSFTYPIVWKMNDAGVYEPDFFPARFVKVTDADKEDDSKPLLGLPAFYTAMSNNGKYVGAVGTISDEYGDIRVVPVIYNTEDKTLKIYSQPQIIDEYGLSLYPRAIADDGTFIGMIGVSIINGNGCFIMKAGSDIAERFVDVFPAYSEKFGQCDEVGYCVPTGISADGSKILGYAYYSDDLYDDIDNPAYYTTFVIEVDGTGVEEINSYKELSLPDAIYSIDGRNLREMTKGINIIRNSDGSVSKILKK
ncbi:MAG: hypothetical protein K2I08_10960 [Muribaculaceae bacterium]|nr:hypothetical protein [Muribaculaceae bacterium]